ncbi:MAG: DMT family transporter [Candidatus Micrarchaeota archaeon]|nr:DMT family transporter [Candidatus Micrarchaeota archaeon]
MDYRIAAFGAMLSLGIYGVAVKWFFTQGGDWRQFIPVAAITALLLTVYFASSMGEIRAGWGLWPQIALVAVLFGLSTFFSILALSDGPIGVVMPIMAMNIIVAFVAGVLFFNEPATPAKFVGAALGLVSVYLLSS